MFDLFLYYEFKLGDIHLKPPYILEPGRCPSTFIMEGDLNIGSRRIFLRVSSRFYFYPLGCLHFSHFTKSMIITGLKRLTSDLITSCFIACCLTCY